MTTHIDNLWVFALASKCTHINLVWSLFIMALLWLAMTFFYWSHPGGPAWGKYYSYYFYSTWRKSGNRPVLLSSDSSGGAASATTSSSMIPGPKGLPLIGSMTLMASLAHRRIAAAATACKARRLMAFSLGDTRVIVTCHPNVAREILNSSVFADRPVKESAYSLMFNRELGSLLTEFTGEL